MTTLFDGINTKNKEKLLKILETHPLHFQKNTSLLSMIKGENSIGFITHGYAQIIKVDSNGTKTIIEELMDEDTFHTSLLSFSKNEYDIIAKEDTELILIDYESIFQIEEKNKEYYVQFIKNLLQITLKKTEERNERIEILTQKTIRNKLLEYFNIMSNKHGSKFIYLPFNFIDLADYLAVDRCAMSRELKNLKEEGFIEIKGKRITLLYDKYSSSENLINI